MNPHMIMDSLKKLLVCTRRKPPQMDLSSPTASATSTESDNCGVTSESARCQPLFTLSELRRRESLDGPRSRSEVPLLSETFPSRLTQVPEETESPCTLASGSIDISEREALIASLVYGGDWQVTHTADSSGTLSERRIFTQSLGCQAEICHMSEYCDQCSNERDSTADAYILARADDLVADYPQEGVRSAHQKPKVENNAPISFQRELNAELCEVNQSNSPSVYPSKMVHVATNLSNVGLNRPSHASHQHGYWRSPLQVQRLTDESELRISCASVSNSRSPSYDPLSAGSWQEEDVPALATSADPATPITPTPIAAAAGDASSFNKPPCSDPEARYTASCDAERNSMHRQPNDNVRNSSDEAQPGQTTSGASDRFGNLSADWCNNLCQNLARGGRDLLHQYLSKREIDEASRALHQQRCGRITVELTEKILRMPKGALPPGQVCRIQNQTQFVAMEVALLEEAAAAEADAAEAEAIEAALVALSFEGPWTAQIPTPKDPLLGTCVGRLDTS